jgi:hypothetical protein
MSFKEVVEKNHDSEEADTPGSTSLSFESAELTKHRFTFSY